jgi:hypothetical protein
MHTRATGFGDALRLGQLEELYPSQTHLQESLTSKRGFCYLFRVWFEHYYRYVNPITSGNLSITCGIMKTGMLNIYDNREANPRNNLPIPPHDIHNRALMSLPHRDWPSGANVPYNNPAIGVSSYNSLIISRKDNGMYLR